METLLNDLRLTVRSLLRSPGFTAAALLTLALGIGANAAMFSIVRGVILRPLPYADPDRLIRVYEANAGQVLANISVSVPAYEDFRREARSISAMAGFQSNTQIITGRGDAVEVPTTFVLGDFFGTLGVPPSIGRPLTENDVQQALRHAVISERFWRSYFQSDPRIIGSTLSFTGRSYTVVGVMPDQFRFPTADIDVWTPRTVLTAQEIGTNVVRTRRMLDVVARVAPGRTLEQARDELKAISTRMAAQAPTAYSGWTVEMTPLRTIIVGDIDRALFVILAVVGAILLIVCVNLANMLLARGATRSREIAVRLAMGASRMRIIQLVLTEPVLLALVGGVVGVALSVWGVQIVQALSAGTLPRVEDVRVDLRVLGFAFILALITGLVFGIVPAVRAARSTSQESLREGRGVVSHGGGLQRVLVVTEFGLAVVLVVCAGLMARSFLALRSADPGIDLSRALAVTMRVNTTGAQPFQQAVQRREEWLQRIAAIPGVVGVGSTTGLPLRERCRDAIEFTRGDGSRAPDGALFRANYCLASSGYMKAVGIPLLRGQPVPDAYTRGTPIPAVVSETAAKRFWPGQDPIGQPVKVMSGGQLSYEMVVVGVAGDVRQIGLHEPPPPLFYFTQQGYPRPVYTLVVRTAGDPSTVIGPIRAAVKEIDPNQPIRSITTLDDVMSESIARDRFFTVLFAVFGGLALVLAAVGVYGVLAYSVAERTHEMGLRMALGASTADVMRLVVGGGMRLVFIGLALGGIAALLATRVLESQLYGVSTMDWIAFVFAIVLLTSVALLACYIPARRATRVPPTVALRTE
jgi:predicted permease